MQGNEKGQAGLEACRGEGGAFLTVLALTLLFGKGAGVLAHSDCYAWARPGTLFWDQHFMFKGKLRPMRINFFSCLKVMFFLFMHGQ